MPTRDMATGKPVIYPAVVALDASIVVAHRKSEFIIFLLILFVLQTDVYKM
jgi:hypothetical protein